MPSGLDVSSSYSAVARPYADQFINELDHKPLDRALLARFTEAVRGRGWVFDVGCGPGHVACWLHEQGLPVAGFDIAPGMVSIAHRLNPFVPFLAGDMLFTGLSSGSLAGITAFYCLIHVPRNRMAATLAEFRRVLAPGGWLLLSFHLGSETLHLDEWMGQPVNLDFYFFSRDEMESRLTKAGLIPKEMIERAPYEIEFPSRRCYILAQAPP